MGMTSKGGIKSIQRGTILVANAAATGTATISSVDTTKSELRFLGQSATAATTVVDSQIYLALTNATTITATRGGTSTQVTVSYELTEWY